MPFYKVEKVMQYTETVYVEADSEREAKDAAGAVDGYHNGDDIWYDCEDAEEVDQEEFEDNQ
jgi:hypothetical protein